MPIFPKAIGHLVLLGVMALPVGAALGARPSDEEILAWPNAKQLARFHSILASEPHVAGSSGDARMIERLVRLFESFGLAVETQEFFPYLPEPIDAALSIVTPDQLDLPLHEPAMPADPLTAHPGLDAFGWNAYSGSGHVTAPVVYANYGTKEDFERLAELGVSCEGTIVLARYGGNFRGHKARYAQAAGAVGLVIFTDPDDNGYNKGAMYPEGGYATPRQIQRGSIKTLPYDGDPLTPFVEATEDAKRLDPASVGLPTIPVQPVGWAAVEPILARMKGPEAPEQWRGGMSPVYRLTGGDDLTIRLMVEQERRIVRTANVIATLVGAEHPEQKVIIGSHHDAWGFGAGDPLSGTIVTIETARALAEMTKDGWRPARSVVFACWGAEEFGVIGSVEWCEANERDLLANAIAYINLDAAAMGPNFHAGASPTLAPLIRELATIVPNTEGEPIRGAEDEPIRIGRLGGGSDHVGFLSHLCIPSINLGAHGAPGSAYHSNYDTIAWYRQVVGSDYKPARMLAQMTTLLAVRLADDPLTPLDPAAIGPDAIEAIGALGDRAEALGFQADLSPLESAVLDFQGRARRVMERLKMANINESLDAEILGQINAILRSADRIWMAADGLPGRPWHRNLYAAPDETSGYGAWAFPGVRHAIESRDAAALALEQRRCVRALSVMTQTLDIIEALVAIGEQRGEEE